MNIVDANQSANEFRVEVFLLEASRDFGSGGLSAPALGFLNKNRPEIQDAFTTKDSIYILPTTKKFANELYQVCLNEADEREWVKLGERYWLSLWWD